MICVVYVVLQVHFKVRFDAKGFSADDIKVESNDHCLTVHAKNECENEKSKSTREFCRILELPRSIEHDQLKCSLTEVSLSCFWLLRMWSLLGLDFVSILSAFV